MGQLFCPDGQYSAVGQLFLRSPEETVKVIFHDEIGTFDWYTLLVFAILYWWLTMWTYGVSVPSGVFIPTLVTGAAWGRLVGLFVNWCVPNPVRCCIHSLHIHHMISCIYHRRFGFAPSALASTSCTSR